MDREQMQADMEQTLIDLGFQPDPRVTPWTWTRSDSWTTVFVKDGIADLYIGAPYGQEIWSIRSAEQMRDFIVKGPDAHPTRVHKSWQVKVPC